MYKRFFIYCCLSWFFVFILSDCGFKLKSFDESMDDSLNVVIQRYDRLESLYLTTGDFSALQQMSTDFPNETRTLIENVLNLGDVDDPEINSKLLRFFQDSTLQAIISDAELQYANVDDLNKQLTDAFHKLKEWLPDIKVPMVYTQICALDQSIIVGDGSVGICLDKYLGKNYALYSKFYDKEQRETMTREYIVPDFLSFYLISIYHHPYHEEKSQTDLDLHMAKIQWVVNRVIGKRIFKSSFINKIERYMVNHPEESIQELLSNLDCSRFM